MVRVIAAKFLEDGSKKKYVELSGLSTDAKPTKSIYATGSLFLEADTGDVYAYDEVTPEWNKIAELGGS